MAVFVGKAQTKITCVGASITEGYGVGRQYSFPGQLQMMLGNNYSVLNCGVSGTTMLRKGGMPYWNQTQRYQEALNSNPDVVFIDLGGNDAKYENRDHWNELVQDSRDLIHPNVPGAGLMAKRLYEQLKLQWDNSFDIFQNLDTAGVEYTASNYKGYECADLTVDGESTKIVKPKKTTTGHPWFWRQQPLESDSLIITLLLERGFHIIYGNIPNYFDNATPWDNFYSFWTNKGLGEKIVWEELGDADLVIKNVIWSPEEPTARVPVILSAGETVVLTAEPSTTEPLY
ncbi:hypothetical protein AGMMS50262_16790 [Bacteroidia bacterium]|nr:hypothetical protein AGMMS50262_16790 [Bacteroidia bacterium]